MSGIKRPRESSDADGDLSAKRPRSKGTTRVPGALAPLTAAAARAARSLRNEYANDGLTSFLICAGAMKHAGCPGTAWIDMCSYRHFDGHTCFIDNAGDLCLLEAHYGKPGGAMTRLLPLLANPPHSVENYTTKPGRNIKLGPLRVRCRATATISRVRIPAGLPNNFRALIMEAGLEHDDVAADMLVDCVEWRPLADHIRRILAGSPDAIVWFREHTLPALVGVGLVVDVESAILITPQPESESSDDENEGEDYDEEGGTYTYPLLD